MRTGAAVALIIVGGALILGPLVADYFNQAQHQANAMKVVEKTDASDQNKLFYLRDRYPMDGYAYLCLAAGAAMAAVGVWGALKRPMGAPPSQTMRPTGPAMRLPEERGITGRPGG